jgi:hypothetical protein
MLMRAYICVAPKIKVCEGMNHQHLPKVASGRDDSQKATVQINVTHSRVPPPSLSLSLSVSGLN